MMDPNHWLMEPQNLSVKHGGEFPIFHPMDVSRLKKGIFIRALGKRTYIGESDD
jgi:hypothetical protein